MQLLQCNFGSLKTKKVKLSNEAKTYWISWRHFEVLYASQMKKSFESFGSELSSGVSVITKGCQHFIFNSTCASYTSKGRRIYKVPK